MTTGRALLLEGIHPDAVPVLETIGLEVAVESGALSEEALDAALEGVAVLGVRSKSRLSPELLDRHPELLAVGCFCIGTDQLDLRDAARRGLAVFNAPFSNTRSVAELTIAEIVALHRRLGDRSRELHEGVWRKSAAGAHEVRGRTLGIIGYGHIGSQVSVLAEAFGMRVVFHDTQPKLALGNAGIAGSLDELLATSDVVSLHVPDEPSTRGLLGAPQIARMKPGAMLINNARGKVVDLDALADALRDGRIGGAAVDVYPSEPKRNDDPFETPLAGLSNVILTPHIGGSTEEAQAAIARDAAGKIARYLTEGSTRTSVSVPEVDLPAPAPGRHRILHFHHNVPGVLGRMHTLLAEIDANITAEYLQSDPEVSYVILDVDASSIAEVSERMRSIPETIRMRTLS
ncbi:MAG: phosphoglycerate dehydrogenase [Planctomycetota bacterium]|nr:phosphoglycerate dehydrogenase [Planctomycetota bacterium]MEE2896372.1 phosphoglycerate dehydrogenase [Planctomycetota bacterium]